MGAPLIDFRSVRLCGDAQHVRGRRRQSYQDSMVGYRASGVPGTVRGREYAWQKFRHQELDELVGPAAGAGHPKGYAAGRTRGDLDARGWPGLWLSPNQPGIFLRGGNTTNRRDLCAGGPGRVMSASRGLGAKDFYEGRPPRCSPKNTKEHGGLITLERPERLQSHRAETAHGQVSAVTTSSLRPRQLGRHRDPADAGVLEERVSRSRRRVGHGGPLHDRSHCGTSSPDRSENLATRTS